MSSTTVWSTHISVIQKVDAYSVFWTVIPGARATFFWILLYLKEARLPVFALAPGMTVQKELWLETGKGKVRAVQKKLGSW